MSMSMCYMGIAQIALDPPFVKRANMEKKVPQTILASLYTPPPLYGQCPYRTNTFKKGASLTCIDILAPNP